MTRSVVNDAIMCTKLSTDISRINLERWKMYKKNAGAEGGGAKERGSHEPDEDQEMVSEIWI